MPLPEASTRCQLNHLLTCKVRRKGVHRLVTADDFHVILTTWDRQLGRFLGLHKRTRSGNRVESGAVAQLAHPFPLPTLFVLRNTLRSCEGNGMRPTFKETSSATQERHPRGSIWSLWWRVKIPTGSARRMHRIHSRMKTCVVHRTPTHRVLHSELHPEDGVRGEDHVQGRDLLVHGLQWGGVAS